MELEKKRKVLFVIGSTGTGKSKLAIDLAARFDGEIINSDKIQVYKGLPIVTNKVTDEETMGISHHLIDVIDPDLDFTAADFRRAATDHVDSIVARGHLPIIAGGSNSFVEELVEGNGGDFKAKYSCCFLWIDVSLPVLFPHLGTRIDRMVDAGLLEEVIAVFDPERDDVDYSGGIRRAIGVPELHRYLMEVSVAPEENKEVVDKTILLDKAIEETKVNTCKLAETQVGKIHRLCTLPGWNIHRLEADKVFADKTSSKDENDLLEEEMFGEKAYQELVLRRGVEIVREFLAEDEEVLDDAIHLTSTTTTTTTSSTTSYSSDSDDGQDGVVDGGTNGEATVAE